MCSLWKNVNFAVLMTASINDLLKERSLEEIEATLDYFGAVPRFGRRRQDLVKALAALFTDSPARWLDRLMEGDLRILKRLCDAGSEVRVELIPTDYPMVIEVLHIATFEKASTDDLVLGSIPAVFYDLIAKEIDAVIERKEKDGTFEVERLALGALNTFGVVPLSTFVDTVFDEFQDLEEVRTFAASLAACPVFRLYQEEYKGVVYMVSPDIENFEDLMRKRRKMYKGVRRYARLDVNDLRASGENAPFGFYGAHTREGQELLDMLERVGYEGDELEYAAHTAWINAQYEPDEKNLDLLLSPVTHKDADIASYEEFVECANIILRYANSVPKWLLKGHSADQTGLLIYSLPEDYFLEEFQENLNLGEEVMKYFDNANRVRPVPPDDPCPCGSGLSYRFCHGKYLS